MYCSIKKTIGSLHYVSICLSYRYTLCFYQIVLHVNIISFQAFNAEIPSIENDFKVTTKTAQGLVKESSQEMVTEMLQSLNIQKEVLVKLRKEIPERCVEFLTLKIMLRYGVVNLHSVYGIWISALTTSAGTF